MGIVALVSERQQHHLDDGLALALLYSGQGSNKGIHTFLAIDAPHDVC